MTHRHLTFFEMLGNFSVGDYFKQGAVEFALELSHERLRVQPGRHLDHGLRRRRRARPRSRRGGDRVLALDRRARRAHRPARPRRQLLAVRPDRALRPVLASSTSTAAPPSAPTPTGPGDDTERFLEFWNLVFMQYELQADGSLPELPAQNIDTGMGLDRMAAILQDVPSVYETDSFRPLIELGEGAERPHATARTSPPRARCGSWPTTAAAMTFLLADGVVPSNEDRGYILRRIMRRAIQQGRVLGIEAGILVPLAERVIEIMGDAYPEPADRARHDQALGRRRGGGLRPHARAGRAPAGRDRDARPRRTTRRGSPPRTPSSCTTPTASPTS